MGIFNSYDTDLEGKLNFLDDLKSINEVSNLWQHRGLRLAGRILIFKLLALSKVLYASTMKCPSKQIVDQLNIMQKGFIWNNKPKIKHSTSVADHSEGGYKDIDIKTKIGALKVAWVTRLSDDNFHPWKIIPVILFTNFGGIKNVFHYNFKASKQCRLEVSRLPKFYQELTQLWSEVAERKCSNASEICGEVLWNNALIMSNGETFYNKHFVGKGILTVKNIIDESGQPLSWTEATQKYDLNNSHDRFSADIQNQ